MRRRLPVATLVALTTIAAWAAGGARAEQNRPPGPPPLAASDILKLVQQGAPQAAAPQPYNSIPITLATPANDPSFEAFRKQLADVAQRKDRAGLAKVVVAQDFFWEGESGDKADKKKAGIDNLAAAVALDDKDGIGWDAISGAAQEPTLEPYADRKGVMCSPASPQFDEKALAAATKATQTDQSEWGFPTIAGITVRGAAQASAPVVDKLGLELVRVMPEAPAADAKQPPAFMRVVTPSGKVGYVPTEAILPLTSDQVCYLKDASGWKIAGYVGGQ